MLITSSEEKNMAMYQLYLSSLFLVSELLLEYHGEVGEAEEGDLKSLCVALVDSLNQRSRALRTQRSANKWVLYG